MPISSSGNNLLVLPPRGSYFSPLSQSRYGSPDYGAPEYQEPINLEVDAIRPELTAMLLKYEKIRDCLQGEDHVKSLGTKYLPRPSIDDDDNFSIDDDRRYYDYLLRATFLNATGFTQRTTVGKLFTKAPTIDLPERLKPMLENVNGEGLAFEQLIELIVAEVFAFGRGGLYADFINTENMDEMSLAESRKLTPIIRFAKAEDIINWRIDKNTQKLKMVVVRSWYEDYNEFATLIRPEYKVFKLDPELTVEHYRPTSKLDTTTATNFVVYKTYQPKLPSGERWKVIPYANIGSNNNDWELDEPPLYSMATFDFALYRNMADNEEMGHLMGQVTPYAAGLDPQFVKEFELHKKRFGSRNFIPLRSPQASIGLVQAKSDTLLTNLTKEKYDILRKLGSTVFSIDSMQDDQTATAAVYQSIQIHAPLVTTSRNVISAVNKVVRFAAMFVGINPETDEIEIKLNSDIIDNPLGIAGVETVLNLWKAGAITFIELREQLRVQGITLHTPEEAESMIDKEKDKRLEQQQKMIEVQQPQRSQLQEQLQSRRPPGDSQTS